jgi:phosphatidylglycerol:prolipoprotein diacylglycerol transferase
MPQTGDAINGFLFYGTIGGLLGGRLAYVINFPEAFEGDWISVLKIWEGGLVSYGGLIGLLIAFALWYRRNPIAPWKRILDWMAPGMAFGHALGRLGCFAAGCCYGKETDLPWGFAFTHPDTLAPRFVPLHPAQLYEAAFLAALGFFLLKRSRGDGSVILNYLTGYAAGRFAIEFFRGDPALIFNMTTGQILSILLFFIALGLRFCSFFSSRAPNR